MRTLASLTLCLSLAAPGLASAKAPPGVYSIADFGAVAGGTTLCTQAIQKATDAAAAGGGGTVWLPAGTWLSGTLWLKSNVTFHLEPGCTLLGSPHLADYPPKTPAVASRVNLYCARSLIYAENLQNVAIEGCGTLDGNGMAFHRKPYLERPFLLRVVNCRDVRVENIRMQSSGCWNQHFLACERVVVRGIRVWNHATHNNDGVDIDGCRDFVVSGCFISSSDDGICLKSTSDRPCRGVLVSDCVVSSHANAIKMGTDSSGGFLDVAVTNCVVRSPAPEAKRVCGRDRGTAAVALEIVDGGRMERVTVSNLVIQGVEVPLFVRLGKRGYGWLPPGVKPVEAPKAGTIRDVAFSNILATGAGPTGCSVTGLPNHRVENITFANVTIRTDGGGKKEWAAKPVEELPEKYPESIMFGNLPCFGLYCRHVENLRLRGLDISAEKPDQRPALTLDDVRDANLFDLRAAAASSPAAVVFKNVQGALIHGCRHPGPLDTFLQTDAATRDVVLDANSFATSKHPLQPRP